MGNVFGREKPLKEIIRENQRMLKKAIRELEKEIANQKKQETKLTQDIKKMAKQNQMKAVRIMAKDLVRTRNYVTRFIEMKTHLNAVSLKMQVIVSFSLTWPVTFSIEPLSFVTTRQSNPLKL